MMQAAAQVGPGTQQVHQLQRQWNSALAGLQGIVDGLDRHQ